MGVELWKTKIELPQLRIFLSALQIATRLQINRSNGEYERLSPTPTDDRM